MISEDAALRKLLRQVMFDEGVVMSRKIQDAVDEQEKFRMYYEYREAVSKIPSHRMLAIRRGEAENVLLFLIELEPLRATSLLRQKILRTTGDWTPQLELAIDDSWQRLLNSSIQTEIRLELKKRSDTEAINVFRDQSAESASRSSGGTDWTYLVSIPASAPAARSPSSMRRASFSSTPSSIRISRRMTLPARAAR